MQAGAWAGRTMDNGSRRTRSWRGGLAADPASWPDVCRQLPRPREYQLRRPDHEPGSGLFARGLSASAPGIFFLGYFLFEVPSNLMLEKVGARLWMCRIMVTWGAGLDGLRLRAGRRSSFYVLRFLLGAAEAGLYPGMILYMTYWFPAGDAGALHRPVPGGGAGGQCDRRRRSPAGCWVSTARPAWLAMDAAAGRHSLAAAGRRRAVAAARPAGHAPNG